MNTIVEQLDNNVCDIIVNKLDLNQNNKNKLLIFNKDDSIFGIKIKDQDFVLNISNNNYIKPNIDSPYMAKMLKVIKHDNKYFIFYEHMGNKLIDIFKIKITKDELLNLKNHIIQCMKVYKEAFDKEGYFTLDSVL